MVEVKIRRFGKSVGVILPKEVLSRLKSGDGDKLLLIEEARGGYRLIACDSRLAKKVDKTEEIMKRYRNTLRALAK